MSIRCSHGAWRYNGTDRRHQGWTQNASVRPATVLEHMGGCWKGSNVQLEGRRVWSFHLSRHPGCSFKWNGSFSHQPRVGECLLAPRENKGLSNVYIET
ncbi:hypothetical protein CC2G_007233 [Coprinopsis cinerea AmutBmut pab1-1]|nr:hypothetical protein CC2G_007233 [Coprinopsis cinerea AmutBmut pab1-1]